MNRILFTLIVITTVFTACRKDFSTVPSSGNLRFSRDTVFLDTTFTRIATNTYTLKVYNPTSNDITIPSIALENANSYYRLMIDGKRGNSIANVNLLAHDSIFIFIETTVDFDQQAATSNEFLYTDRILFDAGSLQQDVDLVTLVKDAIFLYPSKGTNGSINTVVLTTDNEGKEIKSEGFLLDDNQLVWTKEKPYVIYGFAVVPENKTLEIESGARIHFHKNSGLLVSDKATVKSKGALSTTKDMENEIIFEGDNLKDLYSDVSGQWGTIWIKSESVNNSFEYTTIKNGTIGIRCEAKNLNGLKLKNTTIYNHSNYGLLSENGLIHAENCVINHAGITAVALYGGNYDFNHCTITNYWTASYRQGKALELSNQLRNQTPISLMAQISNSIIYGNSRFELKITQASDQNLVYNFNHCLLKFDQDTNDVDYKDNPLYDFSNPLILKSVVTNEDPDFEDASKNKMRIGLDSKAIGLVDPFYVNLLPTDIKGVNRKDTQAAAGAYHPIDLKLDSNE